VPAPKARVEPIAEVLHGVQVPDPYRWLEQGDSEEVRRWVEGQNAHTKAFLGTRPGRAQVRARVSEMLAIGQLSAPAVRYGASGRGRYFYLKREGSQNQPILYVRDGLRGQDRVLVDPNALAADGTAALDWWFPSEDGRLLAYGVSVGGDEQSTLRVREVETGKDLPDKIPRTRGCSLAWTPAGDGFYYTRYPTPGSVPKGEEHYHRAVFFHRLGKDPAADPKIFGEGRDPQDWPAVDLSPNGRWLVVVVQQGWDRSEVYLRDLSRKDARFVAIARKIPAIFEPIALDDRLLVRTNYQSPRYRLYSVNPERPSEQVGILAEAADVMQGVTVVGRTLFVHYLKDVSSRVLLFDLAGKPTGEVELPAVGTVNALSGQWNGEEAFLGFTSFAYPSTILRYSLERQRRELWEAIPAPFRGHAFEVRRLSYPSKDGTKIPMFLVHARGLARSGDHPTVLYGYGGFNLVMTPFFVGPTIVFLERGGILAIPGLRGGGEYGEEWHRAGMLGKKQNVFDDFIAAAEWLIREQYTRPEKLAVSGGSNGGLLVGAALTQRPDLFRAAVCRVPLLDMIRYHRFLIAKLWIPELGSAEHPEQFRWLWAYSPYHRVREGVTYPAVLLTTAESDSRVDPMHARKMAARLQAATGGGSERPILLRTETKAGHGAGKPTAKLVSELTDVWTFVLWQLGVPI
jgi:prolyl oligopeptidase